MLDDPWRALAESLLSNRTLYDLRLERCSVGVEACSALGRALAANTTLRHLDLSVNRAVGDYGVALIAAGLRRNRRHGLRTLALNMCAVGDAGLRSLLVAVEEAGGATALRHVKLCYNRIGAAAADRPGPTEDGPRPRPGGGRRSRPLPFAGTTDDGTRSRPSSVHVEKSSLLIGRSDDITRTSGWQADRCEVCADTVPTSVPIRRRDISAAGAEGRQHRPFSGFDVSQKTLVETSNQARSSSRSLLASEHRRHRVDESDTASSGAGRSPDLRSTATTADQRRTVADGVRDRELPTPSGLADVDGHCEQAHGANMSDRKRSADSADFEGTTSTSFDGGQFPSPAAERAGGVERAGEGDIYALLCQVLRANPRLRVLLWGNQRCQYSASAGTVLRTEDPDGDVASSTSESTSNELDHGRQRTARCTLPRNYAFAPHCP